MYIYIYIILVSHVFWQSGRNNVSVECLHVNVMEITYELVEVVG